MSRRPLAGVLRAEGKLATKNPDAGWWRSLPIGVDSSALLTVAGAGIELEIVAGNPEARIICPSKSVASVTYQSLGPREWWLLHWAFPSIKRFRVVAGSPAELSPHARRFAKRAAAQMSDMAFGALDDVREMARLADSDDSESDRIRVGARFVADADAGKKFRSGNHGRSPGETATRDRKMAEEFLRRRGGKLKDTPLMTEIGAANDLKERGAAKAIARGLTILRTESF